MPVSPLKPPFIRKPHFPTLLPLILFLFLLLLFLNRPPPSLSPSPSPSRFPPPAPSSSLPPSFLLLYPHPPHTTSFLPSYNSRLLLRTPSICLHPSEGPVLSLHLPAPPVFLISSFPAIPSFSHASFSHEALTSSLCLFGNNSELNTPTCPQVLFSPPPSPAPSLQTFHDSHVILVPRLPFLANIYHFLTFATTLEHTISLISPTENVTVLIKGWELASLWQKHLLRVLLNPVQIRYLSHQNGCFSSPAGVYVLAKQGHINAWPFLNRSAIPASRLYVPAGAARFKAKFWTHFGIPLTRSLSPLVWPLPPLKLLYSMRTGDQGRVFEEDDQQWLKLMLKEEAFKKGLQYAELDPGAVSFQEQVNTFANAGVVVGIHGANLVDACFMTAFGAIVEIMGNGTKSLCYRNGANCGLMWYGWESQAIGECDMENGMCSRYARFRRVVIGGESGRDAIRAKVRDAITWICTLRHKFPQGIPVAYHEEEDAFHIDDERGNL